LTEVDNCEDPECPMHAQVLDNKAHDKRSSRCTDCGHQCSPPHLLRALMAEVQFCDDGAADAEGREMQMTVRI